VVDSKDREEIYYFWRSDEHLLERNKFIGGIYQDFIDNPSDQNLFRGFIANFLLESIYFYNGFAFFDTLASQTKMLATDRMINYIRRDELTHITIFANIIKEVKKEFPEIYDEEMIYDMMKTAVKQEIKWSQHIIGEKIIGMSPENIEGYTKYLANQRLNLLGLKPLYPEVMVNPMKHLDALQDNNSEKGNFFETTVANYAQSSAMKGSWDF
jgi:ribonucleoside-diphosphate reductase beta chain